MNPITTLFIRYTLRIEGKRTTFADRKTIIIMEERKDLLLSGAMTYGFAMGVFWVVKYLFFIFSFKVPSLNIVYMSLTMIVPYVAYKMTKQYKQTIGGKIGFLHAWRFGLLLYFFAALIVALEHFVFFKYIAPPDYLTNAMGQMLDVLKASNVDSELVEAFGKTRISPIHMAIQGIFNNTFYGIILSIPVAAILSRKKSTDTIRQ